jgi:hypothetical protein
MYLYIKHTAPTAFIFCGQHICKPSSDVSIGFPTSSLKKATTGLNTTMFLSAHSLLSLSLLYIYIYMCVCVYKYIYIYIYICVCVCVCV